MFDCSRSVTLASICWGLLSTGGVLSAGAEAMSQPGGKPCCSEPGSWRVAGDLSSVSLLRAGAMQPAREGWVVTQRLSRALHVPSLPRIALLAPSWDEGQWGCLLLHGQGFVFPDKRPCGRGNLNSCPLGTWGPAGQPLALRPRWRRLRYRSRCSLSQEVPRGVSLSLSLPA